MNEPITFQELGTLKIAIKKGYNPDGDVITWIEMEFGAIKIQADFTKFQILPLIAALASEQEAANIWIKDARIAPITAPARKNLFIKHGMLVLDAETLHAQKSGKESTVN